MTQQSPDPSEPGTGPRRTPPGRQPTSRKRNPPPAGPTAQAGDRTVRLDSVRSAAQMAQNQIDHGEQLLQLASAATPEPTARAMMRQLNIQVATGVGCCHIFDFGDDGWEIDADHRTGRVPDAGVVSDELASKCAEATAGNKILPVVLNELKGLTGLVAAMPGGGEALLLVLPNSALVPTGITAIKRVLSSWHIRHKQLASRDAVWQRDSLGAILDLVARVEASVGLKEATECAVNEVANVLDCSLVALATKSGSKLRLQAVSGIDKLDRTSETSSAFRQAMEESLQRIEPGIWPATSVDENYMLLAHEQLASTVREEAVFSHTLKTREDDTVGVWILAGSKQQVHDPVVARFVETASDNLASSLALLTRVRGSRLRRILGWIGRKTSWLTRLMVPIAIAAFCALMMLPVTYRMRCRCTTEPVSRRYAVAPFDGLVVSGFVKPGDRVQQGDTLAEIDGRTIRWELSGVVAEHQQAQRQREIELSGGNIPETFLAELESKRLTSQKDILEFKRDNLHVRSPIDGIVLSGSLERAEAASIKTGQVLFEVGPVSPMKLEIAIPADDIAQVQTGHSATVWVEGLEERPITAKITRIHPRSETRDAKNVFIAEIEVENKDEVLRPGMRGHVRIDGEERSLGWSLFHKPIDWARSRLTWW